MQKVKKIKLTMLSHTIKAGFPSPADDYVEKEINLTELIVKNPHCSYILRVSGDSMAGAGIMDGDLLIVDTSKKCRNNAIIVAVVNNEFTVKRYTEKSGKKYLMPENPAYPPIELNPEQENYCWGVVIGVVRKY